MKNIYKSILFGAILVITTMFNWSCDRNDSSGGAPFISYVRVTDPASADSLLVSAGQGQLIAIVGGNLQNTRQIWFNDQQATFSTTYVTNTSILVNVPSQIPTDITDKMKLIFANGDSLLYDFNVKINKPTLSSMDCEYAADGETTSIQGDYLYLPISVTFPGGKTVSSEDGGVTVSNNNKTITFKVPEGSQPGQVTVTSNFGSTKSDFFFRDDRNIFCGFDDVSGNGGGGGTVITNPGSTDPQLINGPYKRVKQTIAEWGWVEVLSWVINHHIPDDAILHPNNYYYKFELNTVKPYNASQIRVWVSDPANNTNKGYYYWYPPANNPIDTKGAWQTIVIPFEDIMAANEPIPAPLQNYFYGFIFCGAGTLDCDMCFDNFRVVLKAIPGNN